MNFIPLVGSFSPRRTKKEPTKEAKYHAAAGYNRFCENLKYVVCCAGGFATGTANKASG
jgi:hypothetical protein